jgi:hypothetical protein
MPRCSCILILFAHVAAARATAADCGAASYTVRSDRSFGTALADVRDLDGDGVNEYAAGSPAEPGEAGRGAQRTSAGGSSRAASPAAFS